MEHIDSVYDDFWYKEVLTTGEWGNKKYKNVHNWQLSEQERKRQRALSKRIHLVVDFGTKALPVNRI